MLVVEEHYYSLLSYNDAMSVMSKVCMGRAALIMTYDYGEDWDDAREVEEDVEDWADGIVSVLNELTTEHWFTVREVLDEFATYYSAGVHARDLLAGRLCEV